MKEKIFVDTDVILDLIFEREPFHLASQILFALIEKKQVVGYTSSLILANCFYIISANKNKTIAAETLSKLRTLFTVLPLTNKEIGEALNSGMKDFEDAVQYFIASNKGLKTILTRNVSDYKNSALSVMTPTDFLNLEHIKNIIGTDSGSANR